MRAAKAACSRWVSGIRCGNGAAAVRCGSVRAAGSSNSASGLPSASVISRRRTRAARAGNRWVSSSSASAGLSGPSSWTGRPAWSKKLGSPGLAAHTNPVPVPASRRATRSRTAALERSSHCTSSSTSRLGRTVDRFLSSRTTASATASGPWAMPGSRPSAVARTGVPVTAARSSGVAVSICTRADQPVRERYWTPVARSTLDPCPAARAAAASSRAVLPTPGSPSSTTDPPASAMPVMKSSNRARSGDRPTSVSCGVSGVDSGTDSSSMVTCLRRCSGSLH